MNYGDFSMVITNKGKVMACGVNTKYQLGMAGDKIETPTEITGLENVKEVSSGKEFTMFLLKDGTVKACGDNTKGQLAIGSTEAKTEIVVPSVEGVKQISCGNTHVLFLLKDGTVKVCGENTEGRLGLGTKVDATTPTAIPDLKDVAMVKAGGNFSMFLMKDGTVKVCGENTKGQLGLGHKKNVEKLTEIPNLKNVKFIEADKNNVYFLLKDNTVLACGANDYGQLGYFINDEEVSVPTKLVTMPTITSIYAQASRVLFLLKNGRVYVSGRNDHGQLGLGHKKNVKGVTFIPGLTSVKSVLCGPTHTIFVKNDGTTCGCGVTKDAQLGVVNTEDYIDVTPHKTLVDIDMAMDNNIDFINLFESLFDGTEIFCVLNNLKFLNNSDKVKKI